MDESVTLLRRVVEDPSSSSPVVRAADQVLKMHASPPSRDTAPLFRTLDEFHPDVLVPYEESLTPPLQRLVSHNVHFGQSKLTYCLLEFLCLTMTHLKCVPDELIVAYVGASGMAASVACRIFPGLKFLLWDPQRDVLDYFVHGTPPYVLTDPDEQVDMNRFRSSHVTVLTGKAGWYHDHSDLIVTVLHEASGRPRLAFLSDIRVDNKSEDVIIEDMASQARWTVATGAHAYMHKFRLPYVDSALSSEIFGLKPPLPTGDGVVAEAGDALAYLDGRLYFQVQARERTGEVRLIGFSREGDPDVAGRRTVHYDTRMFSRREHEGAMNVFNLFWRMHAPFPAAETSTYEEAVKGAIEARCEALGGGGGDGKVRDLVRSMLSTKFGSKMAAAAGGQEHVPHHGGGRPRQPHLNRHPGRGGGRGGAGARRA
jgi:hypothetical protein